MDVLLMPDGALLVSDDYANAIYRIHFEGTGKSMNLQDKKTDLWGKVKKNLEDKKSVLWNEVKQNRLLPNYPNPFNPETWIPYLLSEPSHVKFSIYNIRGQIVRTLNLGQQNVGTYFDKASAAYWDGRNSNGELVAGGIYFYKIQTETFTEARKMELVR